MEKEKKKIAALFDLDGVLIDSESIYSDFWNRMDAIYPTGIADFAYTIKGTTLPRILEYFAPEVQPELRRHLSEQEKNMVYRMFPHVETFLKSLREAHIPTAIVTSSSTAKMDKLFAQLPELRGYFDEVITDADVTQSKPSPEGYRLAASRLGVPSEQCVVFEDSRAGLAAGRSAGGKVVAVATTLRPEDIAGRGDIVIDSFRGFTLHRMEALFD